MPFSDDEAAYLRSQHLARLATVAPDGQPDVVPVGYEFDGTHLYVGGLDPTRTRKFGNVSAGHEQVAIVVDDLVSVRPWVARYLRIYGNAEIVDRVGQYGPYIKITPTVSWSWNLAADQPVNRVRDLRPRRTVHTMPAAASTDPIDREDQP